MASAPPTETAATDADVELATAALERIVDDLAMIVDRDFTTADLEVRRIDRRAAGPGVVHVSFKLRMEIEGFVRHGAFLVPLPDAIALAGYLMMQSDEDVAAHRGDAQPDRATKDGMLEVGNFVAGAVDAVVRDRCEANVRARSAGCQGVRADVRPAFPYEEGQPLVLTTATATLHDYPPFRVLLMLPDLSVD